MFIETLARDPLYFATVIGVVIVSITIHELFHAWAAVWQGDDTPVKAGHITLNPLVHMGWGSIVLLAFAGIAWGATPVNRANFRNKAFGDALVSFAGPLANLVLLVLCASGVVLLSKTDTPAQESYWLMVLLVGANLNAFLFLLNMLPVPPLDGYAIAETFLPGLRQYASAFAQYGLLILLILFFVAGLGDWLAEIASGMVMLTLSTVKNLL